MTITGLADEHLPQFTVPDRIHPHYEGVFAICTCVFSRFASWHTRL